MKLRAGFIGLAFAAAALAPVAVPGVACAAEGPHAALVVDTGDQELTMCVALDAAKVSGTHLIELAGKQHGLSYRFGYGGGAVCMLAGVGPKEGDCFGDYPYFWGYWRGNDSGGWTWSSSGAATTTVSDGDVDGWSWGTGSNGSNHPQPPVVSFASVCGYEPGTQTSAAPSTNKTPSKTKPRATAPAPASPASSASPDESPAQSKAAARRPRERAERERGRRGRRAPAVVLPGGVDPARASPAPLTTTIDAAPAAAQRESDEGARAFGWLALATTVALAVGGLFLRARRNVGGD